VRGVEEHDMPLRKELRSQGYVRKRSTKATEKNDGPGNGYTENRTSCDSSAWAVKVFGKGTEKEGERERDVKI